MTEHDLPIAILMIFFGFLVGVVAWESYCEYQRERVDASMDRPKRVDEEHTHDRRKGVNPMIRRDNEER